jgi:hypothetical protein
MYQILGTYRGESEVLDEADSREDAEYLLGEYQMAFGPEWTIKLVKRRDG